MNCSKIYANVILAFNSVFFLKFSKNHLPKMLGKKWKDEYEACYPRCTVSSGMHHVIRLYQRRWPQEYQSDLHQSHPDHKTKQTIRLTRKFNWINVCFLFRFLSPMNIKVISTNLTDHKTKQTIRLTQFLVFVFKCLTKVICTNLTWPQNKTNNQINAENKRNSRCFYNQTNPPKNDQI